jgi:ribose 5-phosphate isomerase B
MKVYIGADHRGFNLKEKIAKWLFEKKYNFMDLGAQTLDPSDDYPVYAERVASVVGSHYAKVFDPEAQTRRASRDKNKDVFGILICGSGVGVDVVANKFDGVRASLGKSTNQVKAGRNDDDMNVLVLAADFTNDEEAKKMVKIFLKTKFASKVRFKKRLADIEKIEANN